MNLVTYSMMTLASVVVFSELIGLDGGVALVLNVFTILLFLMFPLFWFVNTVELVVENKQTDELQAELAYKQTTATTYTTKNFVCDFYHSFLTRLTEQPDVDFNDINRIFQTTLQKLLSLHKKKKLFAFTPRKHDLLAIYTDLVAAGTLPMNDIIDTVLTSKLVRSSSGVLPISVALDGRRGSCDDDCSMCPNECIANGAKADIARSYLSSEGTFIRGTISDFSIVEQTWRRLAELEIMGHPPDKLEFILLGGTFDCFPADYRMQVAVDIFYACNMYQYISTRFGGTHATVLKEWYATNPFPTNAPLSESLTSFLYSLRPRPIIDLSMLEKTNNQLLRYEQDINTKLHCCRVIGILLETRPDRINRYSLTGMRKLGCTRIQMGIQSSDDSVLKTIKRGHTMAHSIRANAFIRDNGFKIDGHIMPDLPSSTVESDRKTVEDVFLGDQSQLDYGKLYPCLDLPFTEIRKWKQSGKWKPRAEHQFTEFLDTLSYAMSIVPPWTRINRLQRDFPEASEHNDGLGFVSEHIKTNLHQMVTDDMKKKQWKCYEIRSREIRNGVIDTQLHRAKLYIRTYRANEGTEWFISVELEKPQNDDFNDTHLLGLCRLRIPDYEFTEKTHLPQHYLPVYRSKMDRIARIRELHVYGNIVSSSSTGQSQHRGIGKFLIHVAELISSMYDCTLITIISGVGVRDYYEHLGYTLDDHEDQFMVKRFSTEEKQLQPLVLFGKQYMKEEIVDALQHTLIHTTYLAPLLQKSVSTTVVRDPDQDSEQRLPMSYRHHVYELIQRGEAEGFAFTGKELQEKQ